jgi:mono/diheme cytochrome c family protein
MTFRIASLALGTMWTLGTLSAQQPPAPSTAAPGSTRSVLDGVYTEEQAKGGEPLYRQQCASCHGATLEGMDMAPGLSGGAFIANWNGTTVGDLFERIRLTMPQDDPGKLSRQQCAEILAYLLSVSKYPVGKTELPRETEALKQIKFEAAK